MSNSLGSMMVGIGVDTSALASGFNQAKSMIGGFGGVAAGLLVGVTASVVGTGVAAVKMAGDFQTSMTSLVTGAGESSKNLGLVSSGILDMAGKVGESTKELDAGMYLVESAGQHGAQGLTTLKDAAEGAKVGAASLADVANGVTTEMTDYASAHLTAAAATNTLIAAVSEGKTHMGDLATAMSTILPTSAAVHVSLDDTAGALATMTGEGTNAAAAATYLRQLLMALENPASKAAGALKSVGLTSAEVSGEMQKSLPETLQMITDALGKKFPVGSAAYVAALSAIAGGTRQMQGILELTGSHIDVFKNNVLGIADAVKKGGDSILGWSLVQQDFNQKIDEAKGAVEGFMISVGTKFLPVIGTVVSQVAPAVTAFGDWIEKSHLIEQAIALVTGAFQPVPTTVRYVTTAFKEVTTAAKPVFDAFDETASAVGRALQPWNTFDESVVAVGRTMQTGIAYFKPVATAFDRVESSLEKTQTALKPVKDAFDETTQAVGRTQPIWDAFDEGASAVGRSMQGTSEAVNPFVNLMNQLKPAIGDVVAIFWEFDGIVQTVIGDAQTFALGLLDAAEKTGVFQTTLDTVKDILPSVRDFVQQVGSNLQQNLLPPIESLITTVGATVVKFDVWLDKGGGMKMMLNDLGGVIGTTSVVLGGLVQGISNFISFLQSGNPMVGVLATGLTAVGLALAALKIADTTAGFVQMFNKLNEGSGIVLNLAGKAFPNLKTQLDGIGKSSQQTATDVKEVGTAAETSAEETATASTEMEQDLGGIEEQALATETEVAAIGEGAITAEGEVATASTTMEASLGGIEAQALAASTEVEAIGPAAVGAEDVAAPAFDGIGAAADAALGPIGLLIAAITTITSLTQANAPNLQNTINQWRKDHPGQPLPPPLQQAGKDSGLPGFATGGITPGGPIITSEGGPEIIAPPAGWHVYSHQQSMSMLAGSGGFGGTVEVRPQIYLDGQEMTNIIMTRAVHQLRLANGGRR